MLLLQLAIAIQLSSLPLLFLSLLPSRLSQFMLLMVTASCCVVLRHRLPKLSLLLLLTLSSFLLMLFRVHSQIEQIASYKIGKIYHVHAKIAEIVSKENSIIVTLDPTYPQSLLPLRAKLNWSKIPTDLNISEGQRWHFKIKIIEPIQRQNQASHSINRGLISRNIWILASVLQGDLLDAKVSIRQKLYSNLKEQWQGYTYSSLFSALLFGVREQQATELFTLFKNSGIAHLMAISGLHIQLLVSHAKNFFKWIVILLPRVYIVAYVPLVIAWGIAIGYSWLAGWTLPTQRALISYSLYSYCVFKGIRGSLWYSLMLTNGLILLWNPLAILSSSFWLSMFAVVGLTLNHSDRIPRIPRKIAWGVHFLFKLSHLQFSLFIIMLPITIWLFNGVNLFSLISNLMAIPLFSYLLLPLLFTGTILNFCSSPLSQLCWQLCSGLLSILTYLLDKIQPFWLAMSQHMLIGSVTLLLIFILWRIRKFLLPLVSILILTSITAVTYVPRHYWQLDMLDVGHGLAVVITRGKQSILYDTGASWRDYSEAQRVILPFLYWNGFKLQRIIISHQDNDHIGGLPILIKHYPHIEIISSSHKIGRPSCIRDQQWAWEGLTFSVVWPLSASVRAYNKDSCVIAIKDGRYSVLLTGDIERAQELAIVKLIKQSLHKVDLLQVPHHGSDTSSSITFLARIQPQLALISNAKKSTISRANDKNNQVLQRYRQLNIPYRMTKHDGQITLRFYPSRWQLKTYRQHFYAKWYHHPLGNL